MITCQDCGKKVYRYPSAKFCFECIEKHQKEEEKIRRIRKRKGFGEKCIFCGKKVEEIHHADMNKNNDRKDNLIPLCRKCHKKIHSLILKPIIKRS